MSNVISRTFADQAVFKVVSVPSQGIVYGGPDLSVLKVGDTFTQDDIYNGLLRYKNTGSPSNASGVSYDSMTFTIVDNGQPITSSTSRAACLPSPEIPIPTDGVYTLKFAISVKPIPIRVFEESITTSGDNITCLNKNLLYYMNEGHEDSLMIYQVTKLPEFVTLLIYGIPAMVGSKFSQQDINNGKVCIRGNKANSGSTSFSYTITNKWGKSTSGSFGITVPPTFVITLPDKIYAKELTAFCYQWMTHEGTNLDRGYIIYRIKPGNNVYRGDAYWPDYGIDYNTANGLYSGDFSFTEQQFIAGTQPSKPPRFGPMTDAMFNQINPPSQLQSTYPAIKASFKKIATKKSGWYWWDVWTTGYFNSVVNAGNSPGSTTSNAFSFPWFGRSAFTATDRSTQADWTGFGYDVDAWFFVQTWKGSLSNQTNNFSGFNATGNEYANWGYSPKNLLYSVKFAELHTVIKAAAGSSWENDVWFELSPVVYTPVTTQYNTLGYFTNANGNAPRKNFPTSNVYSKSQSFWTIRSPHGGDYSMSGGGGNIPTDNIWVRVWPHGWKSWSGSPWVVGLAGEQYTFTVQALDFMHGMVAEKDITIVVTQTGYNSKGEYEEWNAAPIDPPAPQPPEIQLNIVNTAEELATAKAKTSVVPDPNEVFNQYMRFESNNMYQSAADTPITSDAAAWHYDSSTDRVVTDKNSMRITGFLNGTPESDFSLDVEVYSLNPDDDMNGVVIAAVQNAGGIITTISAVRTNGGLPFENGVSWAIIKTEGNKSTVLVDGSSKAGPYFVNQHPIPDSGWAESGKTVISITRAGLNITAKTSQFGSSTIDDATAIHYTIPSDTVGLKSDAFWGLINYSQKDSYFKILSFSTQKNTNIIYDVTVNPPKIWKYENSAWVEDTRDFYQVVGQPKMVINPTTGKKFYVANNTVRQV